MAGENTRLIYIKILGQSQMLPTMAVRHYTCRIFQVRISFFQCLRALSAKGTTFTISFKVFWLTRQGIESTPTDAFPTAPYCIKYVHWLIALFWPIRFVVSIVYIGDNCNVKRDWSESLLETVVKSNLIGQNYPVNQENPLYNWVPSYAGRSFLVPPTP